MGEWSADEAFNETVPSTFGTLDSAHETTDEIPANLAEVVEMATSDIPTITVLGNVAGAKLVKAEWNGNTTPLSERTISALEKLGISVEDNPDKYLF